MCPGLAVLLPSFLFFFQGLTQLESAREDHLSDTKPRVACNLCFEPVHLIQRRLVDGKIYHRACFSCRQCHSSLLPGSYTQGSDANSLICTHHDNKHSATTFTHKYSCGYLSLSGLAVSGVPHYSRKTESRDGQVCKTPQIQGKERETGSSAGLYSVVKKPTHRPPPQDCSLEENGHQECDVKQETTKAADESDNSLARVQEGGSRSAPAPGRTVSSCGTPVPTPRNKSPQTMSSSLTQGTSDKTHNRTVATNLGSSGVKTNHPWMKIIHPGPWTQLPPAPALVPPPRSKSVSQPSGVWYRLRDPAPNPFDADINDQPSQKEQTDESAGRKSDVKESEEAGDCEESASVEADRDCSGQSGANSEVAVAGSVSDVSPIEAGDEKPTVSSSEAFEELPGPHPPGHGFPLIKRKVQADRCISTEELKLQMGQVAEQLETVEQKGVELEREIRVCTNNKDKEKLLMDWFSLIHQRHVLVRRDTELVYLAKQQELEQRQEDVEYELRCLLNKPEGEWSEEDRGLEQEKMEELVNIIEQRNQIISSLDEDAKREKEEDMGWETIMKNKEFQQRELKELKKSKGKFKTTSVLKTLNQKPERQRDSTDNKS